MLALIATLFALAALLIAAGLRLIQKPDANPQQFASAGNVNRKYSRYAHKGEYLGE